MERCFKMTKRSQAYVYGFFAATAAFLSLVGCFRYTAHTESFRFGENLRKPMDYDGYQEMNHIPNFFEGWDVSVAVWSMRDMYNGQGAGENKYRAEILAICLSDSTVTGSGPYCLNQSPDLSFWVLVDTVYLQVDSLTDAIPVSVDSARVRQYPGQYRFGISVPFKTVEISPESQKILITFTARLYRRPGELVGEKTFRQEMYRYKAKEKGDYWWNRCG